jgi:phosphoribosylanthranilate isomerase
MPRVKVKICGVTTVADALFAAECGADMVGLNFYRKSPRYLKSAQAIEITQALPSTIVSVGVFVDEYIAQLVHDTDMLGLQAAQTYRAEPYTWICETPWYPAFRVKDADDLAAIQTYVANVQYKPAGVLIDSFVAGEMGGTGHTAPWHLLEGFDPGVPVILAGGLTPDNVAEAIRIVKPWGVDVASGVESAPGIKDAGRVRAFLQNAQGVGSV